MSVDMTTFGITLVYVLILQPFALLQILPFRRFLTRVQKRHILIFWCLLIVLEVGLVTAIVSLAAFSSRQIAYWRLGYLVWIPQFVLALCFTRRFWAGHIFIAAFRILFSGIIYTVTRAILLTLCPDRLLPSFYFEQILLYGALSLLAFPFLLRFFTNTFRFFDVASTRRYWRIITLIPVLLAAESLYLSLLDSQEKILDLLLPRLMLLLVIVLLMASIRSGQREVYRELQVFEKRTRAAAAARVNGALCETVRGVTAAHGCPLREEAAAHRPFARARAPSRPRGDSGVHRGARRAVQPHEAAAVLQEHPD